MEQVRLIGLPLSLSVSLSLTHSLFLSLIPPFLSACQLKFCTLSHTDRQTAQGFEVVDSGARFIISFNFLVISPIVSGDQGTYTCTATNSAGMDQASAMLTVFGRSSLIVMEMQSFSNPNQDGSCNEFSSSAFEVQ